MTLGSTQPLTESESVRRADNLTIILCRSCNPGTLTSWNPLGHSRPVTGLFYLYLFLLLPKMTKYTDVTAYDIILSMSAHYVALYKVTANYTKLQVMDT